MWTVPNRIARLASMVLKTYQCDLGRRLRVGFGYNLVGAVFNQGSTVLVSMLIANLLGRDLYGHYSMVLTTLATLTQVAQFGNGATVTKYVAEFRSSDLQKAGRILGSLFLASTTTAIAAASALLVLAPRLADTVLAAPELATALRLAAGVLVFSVMNGYYIGALAGLEGYRTLCRALIASGVGYFIICSVCAWSFGLNGAVVGLMLSAMMMSILLHWALRHECQQQGITVQYRSFRRESSIVARFSLPAAINGFTTMPALWLATSLLARRPGGYSEIAIYSAAFTLMTSVLFLPNVVNGVGTSLINNQRGCGDFRRYRQMYWMNVVVTTSIVCLASIVVAVLGPQLLRLFGRGFNGGYRVLEVLLIAAIVEGFANSAYQVIPSEERMWLSVTVVTLPRDISIVALAYLLCPTYGAIGLAGAYTGCWALGAAATAIVSFTLFSRIRAGERRLLVAVMDGPEPAHTRIR